MYQRSPDAFYQQTTQYGIGLVLARFDVEPLCCDCDEFF